MSGPAGIKHWTVQAWNAASSAPAKRLLEELESDDLAAAYEAAAAESSKLRADLRASMGPIDPVLLRTPMTT